MGAALKELSFQRLLDLALLCLDRGKFDLRDKLMHFAKRLPSPQCMVEVGNGGSFSAVAVFNHRPGKNRGGKSRKPQPMK